MNFVYISPNFPAVMQNFCAALHGNGVNVLGIGDAPYNALSDMLKAALTEYYRVDSLERYDDVLRAVGYFTFKYGKIDWLESNNEYWLAQDARLRTDFNITTGLKTPELDPYKYKSCMKAVFQKAGIPAARWQLAAALEDALRFAAEVGYPIIIKPDNGVGASDTRKIADENALRAFFAAPGPARYIMEEYVPGEVTTYDGLCNSRGEVLFAASHITPSSIMDMVNNADDCFYYVNQPAAKDVCRAGQAVLAALGAKSRCFHLEFFRLTEDKPGLGKRGSLAALEINMRPAGGFTPDMLNYAYSASLYQMYADMVVYDGLRHTYDGPRTFCAYFGRRDGKRYQHTHSEIIAQYGPQLRMAGRMPDALSDAMGNQVYIACFPTKRELNACADFILSPPKAAGRKKARKSAAHSE